ncbi:18 kDa heat shock protein [Caulifigura coniformis]|uniref:18 kDa heat shock protein n=1 Tax=Caulifigura coniformis TaxID=2527983 RepID=A0A517SJ04_9PLAN|nr:Hsp20/alpha crystallin family protein [Caulifigura coniformis]QDT56123.1 18 kDa heat shock protein [Caulifigura coniformis]
MSASPSGPVTGSLERIRSEIGRLVDDAWTSGERAMDAIGLRRTSMPAIDVIEHADRVHVAVDLPGVTPESIDVSIVGNMLTVQGSYATILTEGGTTHLSERPRGTFKRLVPLPASVNSEDVRAESRNGVLQISVGKIETAKPRKIPVSGAQPMI